MKREKTDSFCYLKTFGYFVICTVILILCAYMSMSHMAGSPQYVHLRRYIKTHLVCTARANVVKDNRISKFYAQPKKRGIVFKAFNLKKKRNEAASQRFIPL